MAELAGIPRRWVDYLLEWDRGFESGFLQRRVSGELDSSLKSNTAR
jgi:hypothetical protein